MSQQTERPPRDMLVRTQSDFELREAEEGMPTLTGHFAVFNRWTEIHSLYEGHFLERVAPGAFAKAFGDWKANPNSVRVTFQHGQDPQLGDKVLGIPESLEEDDIGARYAVPLFDTAYNRELLPGLKAGAYGASFRFQVPDKGDDFIKRPPESEHNPDRLPERTVKALRLYEFGPVTYPAYPEATAGVRSLTDEYIRMVLGAPVPEAAVAHLGEGSQQPEPVISPRQFRSDSDWLAYVENTLNG